MTDLITRLEAATGNERGLFEEAFEAVFGEYKPSGQFIEGGVWQESHALRFKVLLDAQAWESAVRMLCPPGLRRGEYGTFENARGYWHTLDFEFGEFEGFGLTPENAFASTCLKAKEQSNG